MLAPILKHLQSSSKKLQTRRDNDLLELPEEPAHKCDKQQIKKVCAEWMRPGSCEPDAVYQEYIVDAHDLVSKWPQKGAKKAMG